MDNKRLVIVIVLSMVVVLVWSYINILLQRLHPEWYEHPSQQTSQGTTAPAGSAPSSAPAQPVMVAASQPATAPRGQLRVAGGDPMPAALGHSAFDPKGRAQYPLALTIDPRGAAISSVTLNRFRRVVNSDDPYVFQTPYGGLDPSASAAMAVRSITVNGMSASLWDVTWRREEASASSARYAVDVFLPGGAGPLTVIREFRIRPASDRTAGYEVAVHHRLENRTGQPLSVKLTLNGPLTMNESAQDVPEIVVGHNRDGSVSVEHTRASSYEPGKPPASLDDKDKPLLWAGVTSAYFLALVRPEVRDGRRVGLADVTVRALAAHAPSGEHFISLTFESTELPVPAAASATFDLEAYFGPRQRKIVGNEHFGAFPLAYNRTLVLTGGLCAFCTFQWLIDVLVWMLSIFHFALRDWGLAIIALVIIVRLLLHPVSKKSQVSMHKMSKMAPEIERIKKKYGDNKEELNKAMMEFYKQQGFTPVLGCLPMLLQMPIWIALWTSLQSTFELRHASFLWGLTWINDLSQPDRLIYFPKHAISLLFLHVDALNVLPIMMGVVFWLQQKMTPQPAAATPEQQQQQKMMQWMSLLFPLLLYSGPSGLNLYILTSTLLGIWESKRVRDHIKRQEELERGGRIIVDAPPTRVAKQLAKGEEPKPERRGWWARLMDRVAEVQKRLEKQYGKGRK